MKMKVTDLQFLKNVSRDNPDFLKEVIQEILSSSERYIREMELFLNTEEWQELAKVAHKFQSQAAIIKAISLQDKLQEIEFHSLEGKQDSLCLLLESIKDLNFVSRKELEEELDKLRQ